MPRKKRRPGSAARKPGRKAVRAEAVRTAAPAPSLLWHRCVEAVRARWRRIPRRFLRGFLVSLAIAAVFEFALHQARERLPRFQDLEDRALDWSVGVSRGAVPFRRDPVGYTFLDIDERTYREWGEPSQVPRGRLARLVERSVAACPKLVIVDVDLTQPSGPEDDAALVRALHARAPCRRQPPILLPATLRGPAVRIDARNPDGEVPWERRPSFLEPALAGNPNVAWASPLFDRASDWQIRHWRLWERVCPQGEGRPEVVPSIQLLAAGALLQPHLPVAEVAGKIRATVGPTLAPCPEGRTGKGRGSHEGGHAEVQAKLTLGPLKLPAAHSRHGQRIVYRYPAPSELGGDEPYPRARDPRTGRQLQLLSVVPAAPLARDAQPLRPGRAGLPEGRKVDPAIFRDRVVVIGGSFLEGRDVYRTPLGPMPGALILINAIDSLLEHGGGLEEPGPALSYCLVALSLLAMSAIFAAFHPLKSLLLALGLIAVLLIPLSLVLFRDGYWLDFVVPVVAVFLHKAAADAEGLFHRKHEEAHG